MENTKNMENTENKINRTMVGDLPQMAGKEVMVCGWVQTIRTHGKIMFFDLRDRTGVVQAVFIPKNKDFELAKTVRSEWVVAITGMVQERPANMVNAEIATGKIELFATGLEVYSEAETLPFPIDNDGYDISEEHRLKYRYLDLRRQRLSQNISFRHKINNFIRHFLTKQNFIEIDTPYITRSTPEGARDFLVPSRLQPGKFFALPQSPQQYKQLLMVAGLERYFQLARCFRDEDTRGDRQPEFTQLDMEMSFMNQEEIMALNENLLIELVKELCPEKKIQQIPFPRISYQEAQKLYQTDRPDIRKNKNDQNELAFCWVVDFPFFEKDEKDGWTFTHNPFSAPKSEFMADLLSKNNIAKIMATQYDIVLNGEEIGGGSIRNHNIEALKSVFEIMNVGHIEENFGHIFEAFSYGAPPHGGIAWGIDRLMMILKNEPNIREMIAFPKTGDGQDLMMKAPSGVSDEQLKELGIAIIEKNKK